MNLLTDDRGVVGLQVGLALVVLLGFSAFSIDYGVMWVAREQAQNAADSGALYAATTLAFDDMGNFYGIEEKAAAFTSNTLVWGEKPAAVVDICYDPGFCPTIPGLPLPESRSSFAATVSVYRDSPHGNALPTYMAALFGVSSQGARAQATAMVVPANVATCVWPLAIPDNWGPNAQCIESTDPPCKPFSRYQYPAGPPTLVESPDVYGAPSLVSEDTAPTGYQLDELNPVMKSTAIDPQIMTNLLGPDPDNPGLWLPARRNSFAAVQIGSGSFTANLTSCNPAQLHFGDTLSLDPTATWQQATDGAVARSGEDGGADWDEASFRIKGSCAVGGSCGSMSPRLVLIPMFDPDRYDATRAGDADCGNLPCIRIVNFAGFFIDDDSDGTRIVGHLTTYPGRDLDMSNSFVGYKWAFLRTAVITR